MRPGKKFTRGIIPSTLCLLVMLLAACGGSTSTTPGTTAVVTHPHATPDKQVLISGAEIGYPDIYSFDPALAPDLGSALAIYNVFTGLVQLDNNLNVEGELASSWKVSDDHLTYTFTLKPGLKFSDGTALTSTDVVYSINRSLLPVTASQTAPYYLRYIKDSDKVNAGTIPTLIGDSLLAPDAQTVVIKAAKPIAFFLDSLTFQCAFVVEKSLIDKWGKKWTDHLSDGTGGGDGPFSVQEYTHKKQIVFVPNPNFFGPKPQLQKVITPFFEVADTAYQVYQTGGLSDTTIPLSHYATDKKSPEFHMGPSLAINYYTMNYLIKPFDNTHFRRAFALAINKDTIVHNIWKDTLIATNHIVPKGQPGYAPNLTGPDGASTAGNPAMAMTELQMGMQQEGYTSVSQIPAITLTYSSAGSQDVRNEATALQQMWQTTLGINVKLSDININTLFHDEGLGSNNPLQFYTGPGWIADYPDASDWTTLQFDAGASQNGMSFGQNKGPDAADQQSIQKQLEAADVNPDSTARNLAYNGIEQQLVNYVAWLPMDQSTYFYLRRPCVQGTHDSPLGLNPPEDWATVYISTDTPCTK